MLSLLIGYVFGCFLTADLVSRVVAKKPVFELGDGNPGMANVGHMLGVRAAAAVLAGDILKTLLAFFVARAIFVQADTYAAGIWAVTGATFGHNFPFWHRFDGGKGVTTTCSAIILSDPVMGIVSSLVGLGTVLLGGYLCWGAVAITLCYALATYFLGNADLLFSALILLALMWLAHGKACRDVRDGSTPRAELSDAFWAHIRHKG